MKIFRTNLSLIMLILIMCGLPAYATTWENETGPYPTTVVNDTGPDGTFYIYRSQTLRSNTHPLAVFCVGTGSHPRNAAGLLTNLASHGVVVIVSTNAYQSDGSQASVGVNWLMLRRQKQYIGKLMRSIDPAPIQAQIDAFNGASAAENAKLHRPKNGAKSSSPTTRR